MSAKYYHAPWGRRVWLITSLLVLFVPGLALGVLLLADQPQARTAGLLTSVGLALLYAVIGLFVVRGYELTDDAVLVQRSFWRTRIALEGIESAVADPHACKGAWKIAGNDGLFAIHGWFRSKRLGNFRAFVTEPENAVLLRISGRVIIISPEHPRQFVNDLNRRLGRGKEQP